MAYLKPPAIETKIFNRLAMHSRLWDVHTLEVARRNAVDPQRVPVVPVEHDGSLFVVSARGESDWVKTCGRPASCELGRRETSRRMPPRRSRRTSAQASSGHTARRPGVR